MRADLPDTFQVTSEELAALRYGLGQLWLSQKELLLVRVDDEIDVMLVPYPEAVEVHEALLRSFGGKEALVRSLKEEKAISIAQLA